MQSAVPSALFETDGSDADIHRIELSRNYRAVGIGPGIGTSDATIDALESFLKSANATSRPLVLDADALNCIAFASYNARPYPSTLGPDTARRRIRPYLRSAAKLIRPSAESYRSSSDKFNNNSPQRPLYRHCMARRLSPFQRIRNRGSGHSRKRRRPYRPYHRPYRTRHASELAAVAGVYVHGIAGRMAAERHGICGTTAEDIAECVGAAMEAVMRPNK